MQRLVLALMAIGEGLIFFTGCCIIFCSVGLLLASFKSSITAYIVLGGWSLSGIVMLVCLIKALWQGRRFIAVFDHEDDEKKEPAGVSTT